jgi:hypothetical protein
MRRAARHQHPSRGVPRSPRYQTCFRLELDAPDWLRQLRVRSTTNICSRLVARVLQLSAFKCHLPAQAQFLSSASYTDSAPSAFDAAVATPLAMPNSPGTETIVVSGRVRQICEKSRAVARIEELTGAGSDANGYDQDLVEAIMTDDGGPQPERGSDTRSRGRVWNRSALAAVAPAPHTVRVH